MASSFAVAKANDAAPASPAPSHWFRHRRRATTNWGGSTNRSAASEKPGLIQWLREAGFSSAIWTACSATTSERSEKQSAPPLAAKARPNAELADLQLPFERSLVHLVDDRAAADFVGHHHQRFAVGTVVRLDENHSLGAEITIRREIEGVGERARIHVVHQLGLEGI